MENKITVGGGQDHLTEKKGLGTIRRYENVEIEKLKPYDKNARTHSEEQVNKIAKSIEQFGFVNPVLIDGDYGIIAGHGRVIGAKQLGMTEVPCIFVEDLTETQKRAYILADNKLALDAGWDNDILIGELEALKELNFNITLAGFDVGEIKIDTEQKEIEEDDFEAEPPAEPKAKLGDIYQLGEHRLMCGDSTREEDVEKLMDGKKADLLFTDPPYNVAFNGRSGNFDVIKNDNLSIEDFNLFISNFVDIVNYLKPKNYYIWCNWKFYGILQQLLDFKACIVWAKNVFGLGRGYRHQHEFCLFNGTIDDDITNESDLWEIKKDFNYIHPTQKPIALSARAIKNHKNVNNVVDLFGGSGSTLIGCEQLNRKCYMMELDPHYIDVIIQRWEKYTGQKAIKIN